MRLTGRPNILESSLPLSSHLNEFEKGFTSTNFRQFAPIILQCLSMVTKPKSLFPKSWSRKPPFQGAHVANCLSRLRQVGSHYPNLGSHPLCHCYVAWISRKELRPEEPDNLAMLDEHDRLLAGASTRGVGGLGQIQHQGQEQGEKPCWRESV